MTKRTARFIHACHSVNIWSIMLIAVMPWAHRDMSLFQMLATYPFVIALALFISGLKSKEEIRSEIEAKWRSEGLID